MARTALLTRLADGLPAARTEAVYAVLRSSLCAVSCVVLLLAEQGGTGQLWPAVVNGLLAVVSLAVAVWVATVRTSEAAAAVGRWSTAGDVLAFATYSAAFHARPGAGAMFAIWVLLAGPVRYGLRGVPLTGVPVALTAIVWPQVDATGVTQAPGQVVALCLLFAAPAVVVRAVVMRGSARVRLAEQQFASAFEHASIGMALADSDLKVLQANRSLAVLLGTSADGLQGVRLDEVVDAPDRVRLADALSGLGPLAPSARLEVRLRRRDGGLRWGHVSASLLSGGQGVPARLVLQVENITERKRSEAMLSHAAGHDALTDLPNRTLLLKRLDAALQRGEQVGVLFLDLDRFKVVNDGLGHAAGDLLLVQVAIRLREVMRPDDMVARLGGDEFVVLCRSADEAAVTEVAGRVLETLSRPMPTAAGGDFVIGASVGIALGGPEDDAETVLRDADTAMYAAKAAGGGRSHLFSTSLRDAVVRTHELEVELRAAVRADELHLVYQPVIEVVSGRLVGCEALVRWQHPRRGALAPTEFVGVAEQSDLVLELGTWVLRRALAEATTWPSLQGHPAPSVSINVSLRQLVAPGFAAHVRDLVQQAGIDPARVCLEVTETALAGDVESVVSALQALRDVGVRLAIDDFGTGHASLTYLARFPVDEVKVDQSFVAGLGSDAGSAAIVGGVVAMAHTFDMRVVAEGVENETQLAALREVGCDDVQGYLFSHPRPSSELLFQMRRQPQPVFLPTPRPESRPVLEEADHEEALRYRMLVDGAREITGGLDLETVLEHAFHVLHRVVAFEGGSILLVEDDHVRIAAAQPDPTPEALAARIPLGQGVSGTIAVTGQPRYLPDILIAQTVTAARRTQSASTGVRSWYGVPLVAEGRPIGVLQIDSVRIDAFSDQDRLAVLSFAPVVTLAVVCAQRAIAQLREIQQGK